MQAYMQYSLVVKKLISLSVRMAAHSGIEIAYDPISVDEGRPALGMAEAERTTSWESVLLFGAPDVIIAARSWHQAAYRLQAVAMGAEPPALWPTMLAAVSSARKDFYVAVKRDLGILVEDADAYEWQIAVTAANRRVN